MQLCKSFCRCVRLERRPAQDDRSCIHASVNLAARLPQGSQFTACTHLRGQGCQHLALHCRTRRSRSLSHARAALPEHGYGRDKHYTPFSAELLLSVARLGHLERYREEVRLFYEPSTSSDLTRCALLISNIYQPQLDHRPYYTRLAGLTAAAALEAVRILSVSNCNQPNTDHVSSKSSLSIPQLESQVLSDSQAMGSAAVYSKETDAAGAGDAYVLDPSNPQHLLCAISAINHVLFACEGLSLNTADPHDPLNGSLADVMDTRTGNQYALAVMYLHVASALGLSCKALVSSSGRVLIRIGDPPATGSSSVSTRDASLGSMACFVVDVSCGGTIYQWHSCLTHSSSMTRSRPTPRNAAQFTVEDQPTCVDDAWQRNLQAWLRRQRQQASDESYSYTYDVGQYSSTHSVKSYASEEVYMLGNSSNSLSTSDSSALVDDERETVNSWQEVEAYAAADVASRNSWKALYGPGALTEWGGLVSSSCSVSDTQYEQQAGFEDLQIPPAISQGDRQAAKAANNGQWGVLDSPFAAAAHVPFTAVDTLQECLDKSSSSSSQQGMVGSIHTCCSLHEQGELLEAASDMPESNHNDTSLSSSTCTNPPAVAEAPVKAAPGPDAPPMSGGLQPMSNRMLLQHLLSGMKLSLTLSGRDEEALLVIRYLRATDPFSLPDLRDEALLLAQMQQHAPVISLLREYLAVAPGAADAEMVREVLEQQLLAMQLATSRAKKQQQ